ncbi:MAG: glycosyltransferase, partial [Helicobacter sp.]|uniref:glycosyltransferase n=1 Tax=Helicobacter sp. TaxID=218 RepID=UPI0025B94700
MAKLSLVCPCYNEASNLGAFCEAIFAVIEQIRQKYPHTKAELIFINDGSKDATLAMLHSLQTQSYHTQDVHF